MEKVKIHWTIYASKNLESIYDYIAEDSVLYAERFIENLILVTKEKLSTFPKCGRNIEEFKNTSISQLREIIYKNYRIVYHFIENQNQINIITIIHAKMNFPTKFNLQ